MGGPVRGAAVPGGTHTAPITLACRYRRGPYPYARARAGGLIIKKVMIKKVMITWWVATTAGRVQEGHAAQTRLPPGEKSDDQMVA